MDSTLPKTAMAENRMTTSHILILPEHLANQIAAGEVVQRPESVVKELVENAIDAGAHSISVVVRDAGKQLIHIIDDGSGMSRDDLELSIVRHATSKIRSIDDLHAIGTLGFRGEALASISAVADVEIRTRRDDDEHGWTLHVQPGRQPTIEPSGGERGTQIIVRNLFYTVPARRKFLKSDLTEFRYVSETMQKLALSRPDVRFTFYDGNALVFDVQEQDVATRISETLGVDARRQLVPVSAEEGGIKLTGYVGLPAAARQSRSGQFFFLNQRSITSRPLAHAVVSAYEHLLDVGQHPVFVLYLDVDPHRVDVNVHPQKHEVKFDDDRTVYLLVQQAVAAALRSANVIPSFIGDLPLAERPLQSLPDGVTGTSMIVNRFTGEILPPTSVPSRSSWPSSSVPTGRREPAFSSQSAAGYSALFGSQDDRRDNGNPVFQLGGQYLVTSSTDGVVIVDQRAAHERVLYERLIGRTGDSGRAGQALLFSVTMKLAPSRLSVLREYLEDFASLGFRMDIGADGTVNVHAVPTEVKAGSEEIVLEELLQGLEDTGRLPTEQRRDALAVIFSARQSVRRGDRLSPDECRSLVSELFAAPVPHVTPRGEPTYIVVGIDEIVQRFR